MATLVYADTASPPFLYESTAPSNTHPSPNHYPSSNRTNVKSGVSALSSTSTAFGTAASNNRLDHAGNGHIDEALRQQALAEEEAAMNQYKVLSLAQHSYKLLIRRMKGFIICLIFRQKYNLRRAAQARIHSSVLQRITPTSQL